METLYIVGLGNPGISYTATRHNIGKELVKKFAEERDLSFAKQGSLSMAEWVQDGMRIVVALPDVFMNHSGRAVVALLGKKKEKAQNLLILVDDLETKLGCCKIVFDGGSRGHNGLRSVHKELGTKQHYQLRVGIGRPISVHDDVAEYVLSSFTEQEKTILDSIQGEVEKLICQWIEDKKKQIENETSERK